MSARPPATRRGPLRDITTHPHNRDIPTGHRKTVIDDLATRPVYKTRHPPVFSSSSDSDIEIKLLSPSKAAEKLEGNGQEKVRPIPKIVRPRAPPPVFSSSSDSDDEIPFVGPSRTLEEFERRRVEAIKMETRETATRFPPQVDFNLARVR
jgi:hypothetical protein